MKNVIITGIMVASILLAGCGEKNDSSESSASPDKAEADAASSNVTRAEVPEMLLQSGDTLRGFRLHFVNHEHNWKLTTDPIRIRISDSETRDIAREKLRGIRVEEIERDEQGFVKKLQVIYATADGEISGWSFPLGVFAFQVHLSPEKALSVDELNQLFIKETGIHVNYEVREVDGQQFIRVPLVQNQPGSLCRILSTVDAI